MARSYAKISTSIWASKKFGSLRGDRPKLLYFYFHTCPQVVSCGCFRIPIKYVVADLGWGANQVAEAIESLSEAYLIAWNESEEIVRIVGFLDHDPPTNPKHAGAIARTAQALPDCKEKVATLYDLLKNEHALKVEGLRELYDRLMIAYPEAIDTPLPLSPVPTPTNPRYARVGARGGAPRTKMPEVWPSEADKANAVAYWLAAGREDIVARLDAEILKVRAHHLSKGTRAADWPQTWVTWYTKALEIGPRSHQPQTAKILKAFP